MRVLLEIYDERLRQVSDEGFTAEHDDAHAGGELALAAAAYACSDIPHDAAAAPPALWPWAKSWWKPRGRRRNLIRAAALLVAELERMDRKGRQ